MVDRDGVGSQRREERGEGRGIRSGLSRGANVTFAVMLPSLWLQQQLASIHGTRAGTESGFTYKFHPFCATGLVKMVQLIPPKTGLADRLSQPELFISWDLASAEHAG